MLVAVGGHSRNIGKTSVVAGLIRAMPEARWTALKITQFGHGICSAAGKACTCSHIAPEHPYAITEETDPAGHADTKRFLAAGAARSLWLRTGMGQLRHAVPAIREILDASPNVIIESNSLLEFISPDLFVMVLDCSVGDFKSSSRRFLERADALVMIDRGDASAWPGIDLPPRAVRFPASPPQYTPPALVEFVRERLVSGS